MYVYAQIGISLLHNAAMQFGVGTRSGTTNLAPGDLVFFYGLGHVGMYIGGGSFIHFAHRRRGQDLAARRLRLRLRRGAALHLTRGPARFVEPFDLGGEVLLDDTSLQLHGRGHLALLRREVAGRSRTV